MKVPKCYVIETTDAGTTTKRSFDPFPFETRRAKERIIAIANSGASVSIEVIENIAGERFATGGRGELTVRTY